MSTTAKKDKVILAPPALDCKTNELKMLYANPHVTTAIATAIDPIRALLVAQQRATATATGAEPAEVGYMVKAIGQLDDLLLAFALKGQYITSQAK